MKPKFLKYEIVKHITPKGYIRSHIENRLGVIISPGELRYDSHFFKHQENIGYKYTVIYDKEECGWSDYEHLMFSSGVLLSQDIIQEICITNKENFLYHEYEIVRIQNGAEFEGSKGVVYFREYDKENQCNIYNISVESDKWNVHSYRENQIISMKDKVNPFEFHEVEKRDNAKQFKIKIEEYNELCDWLRYIFCDPVRAISRS